MSRSYLHPLKRGACKPRRISGAPPKAVDGSTWIPLTKGKWALVDNDDAREVIKYNWMIDSGGYPATGSMLATGTYGKRYLHTFLMNPPDGFEVDHINGDKLDARRSNLRLATRSQQCFNKGHSKNNTSGVKGVSWSKAANKWIAYIWLNRKQIYLGIFQSIPDASDAYKKAAEKMYGEFAKPIVKP